MATKDEVKPGRWKQVKTVEPRVCQTCVIEASIKRMVIQEKV